MRLGIDLDGVCYDFDAACRRWILQNDILPPEALAPTVRWHMYRDWGMTDEEFVAMCDEATDVGYMFCDGSPMPGTIPALYRLQAAGHELHLVTARNFGSPGAAEANTSWWLNEWQVPHDSLTLASNKTAVEVDIFLDDRDRNYDEVEAKWPGVPVLMDRPYNREGPSRRRVSDWLDFELHVAVLDLYRSRSPWRVA